MKELYSSKKGDGRVNMKNAASNCSFPGQGKAKGKKSFEVNVILVSGRENDFT